MKRRAKQHRRHPILAAVFLLFLVASTVLLTYEQYEAKEAAAGISGSTSVYFLDAEQADSTLISLPDGSFILIDAGTAENAKDLCAELKNLGVRRLEKVIVTHPHADHAGGMTQVVKEFEIGCIYMPEIPEDQIPAIPSYSKFLDALEDKRIPVEVGKAGVSVLEREGVTLKLLAPNSASYENLNDYSIAALLTIGERKFLFTGDAEETSEKEMRTLQTVRADVLKCGHHGSSTSTGLPFLRAVSPQYAVISCGEGNDYGHPHQKVLRALEECGVSTYRTDQDGMIRADCDGKTIRFTTEKEEELPMAG